jgi:hypothetical protein
MWRKRGLPDGGGVRGDDPHSLFEAMDFTLAQLTPENLELIFQGAFYKTQVNYGDQEGQEGAKAVSLFVDAAGSRSVIWANHDMGCLWFCSYFTGFDGHSYEDMLKASNFYDNYPVHAHVVKAGDGSSCELDFSYAHFVPDGAGISARDIVGIYRHFEKMVLRHMTVFNQVMQAVA